MENSASLVTLNIKGNSHTFRRGVSVTEVLQTLSRTTTYPPLGAMVHNRLVDPDYEINQDCDLTPVNYDDFRGMSIYRRTAVLILIEAMDEVYPGNRLVVGQSMANGYYFHPYLDHKITKPELNRIGMKMREIVAENRPVRREFVPYAEAKAFFQERGEEDKVGLLQYLHSSELCLISCGRAKQIYIEPMAYQTGLIKVFSLASYENGFILRFPSQADLARLPTWAREWKLTLTLNDEKLFQQYNETRYWNKILGVENVGQVNRLCITGEIRRLISIAEALHEKKIAAIADQISRQRDRLKLVLIAGPSSSGKTTFAKRLMIQLQVNGLDPIALSMDNYYKSTDRVPRDQEGVPDFEDLDALELDLFNSHLQRMLSGEPTDIPLFDFRKGERKDGAGGTVQLTPGKVLIVEGIHGINPRLTASVPEETKFKIYVSALPQLRIDDHNRIFTADTRLLRRLVRDRKYRGCNAAESLARWPSVRRGENRNIFPFQNNADVTFNSALVYELGVLKHYAELALLDVSPGDPEYCEADRLLNFLSFFAPIAEDDVPSKSILREFIGKSFFEY